MKDHQLKKTTLLEVGDRVTIRPGRNHKGRSGKIIWRNVINTEFEVELEFKNGEIKIITSKKMDFED